MKIVIDIPDEQIKKSLKESKHIHEDEGEKGFVNIMMLYTNGQLDFVDVSRKTDFYSCKYKILPKGHGRLIDADELLKAIDTWDKFGVDTNQKIVPIEDCYVPYIHYEDMVKSVSGAETIIEAESEKE